ncbi:MAG TPA: tetraacyldisaccharide 4'-kinase [Steroidobacteraceae bacterium]|jgi:tetraacyldisaccharide 4'-kinase|nr:tetraacyldisaccharide 4'-kinase [Steroidobacteraceae bacterium]
MSGVRNSADSWLNAIWYGGAPPPWWLKPLSAVYGAVALARRFAYAKGLARSTRLACPVIVVGNLTVGGTGKTPLVCWLAEQLTEQGFRPGVVTRGYGGSSRAARLVRAADRADVVGDEAVLLALRSRAPVAIGRARPRAAQLLINAGCNVILSDDGLQHHALARDCEIIVVDGDRRFGNGRLLPAGPLREAAARINGVDAVVINGGPVAAPGGDGLRMRLLATNAIAMKYGTARPLREFCGTPVHALAAIGNPQRFFAMLRGVGLSIIEHPLPDHAQLTVDDISFADEFPVLMTEKDAVKCAQISGPSHWRVPVSVAFAAGDAEKLRGTVARSMQQSAARA